MRGTITHTQKRRRAKLAPMSASKSAVLEKKLDQVLSEKARIDTIQRDVAEAEHQLAALEPSLTYIKNQVAAQGNDIATIHARIETRGLDDLQMRQAEHERRLDEMERSIQGPAGVVSLGNQVAALAQENEKLVNALGEALRRITMQDDLIGEWMAKVAEALRRIDLLETPPPRGNE